MVNEAMLPSNAQIVQMPPSQDYNIFIQEMTAMVKKFDYYLLGVEETRDQDGNVQVEQVSAPMVNAKGRKAALSWVTNYVNANVYLANNNDENLHQNYRIDALNVLTDLFDNLNEYELTIENAKTIHSHICQIMFHSLKRSMSDKDYIFNSIKTTYAPQQQQEKPKLWGLF